MKIIHCADIHADSKMDTHLSKEKADERRNEIVDTFSNMVKFAKENGLIFQPETPLGQLYQKIYGTV